MFRTNTALFRPSRTLSGTALSKINVRERAILEYNMALFRPSRTLSGTALSKRLLESAILEYDMALFLLSGTALSKRNVIERYIRV
jgi:hypothetical protein